MQKSELNKIKAFQELFDVPLAVHGALRAGVSTAHVQLNRRLIMEEMDETAKKGVLAGNLVEIADGCADSIYVIGHAVNQLGRVANAGRDAAALVLLHEAAARINFALSDSGAMVDEETIDRNLAYAEIVIRGIAAAYCIPLDKVFAEVHRSNMTKQFPDGKGRKDAGGKILKPDTYSKADVKGVLEKYPAAD